MENSHTDFFGQLIQNIPEINDTYTEHILDYGELLPHVLMGDVTRWIIRNYKQRAAQDSHAFARAINFLSDQYATGDPETRNLLEVSFVENLPAPGCAGSDISDHLGATLEGIYREIFPSKH
jgi:hypothetical protein